MTAKKTSLKTLVTAILGGAFFCIALTGCENFLKGSDLKNELERTINYNNAKDVNVLISCKEDMGSVFPQATYKAKVGFPFELQFIINSNNYLIKDPATIFKTVSRIDNEQSRADYVEFKAQEQSFEDKKAGLYRVNVKILKYAEDLLIQPDCVEIPYVTAVEPNMDKGYSPVNTPIFIHFNTEVDNSNILDNIKISLAYDNSDMSSLFGQAAFTEDKKSVVISPKPKELKTYITNVVKQTYLDILISLSDDIIVVKDDYNLSLSDIGGKNFTVSYVPKIEEIAPKSYGFFVSSQEIDLENLASSTGKKFTSAALDTFGNPEILQNRSNGTVYIYGKYYDAESGVKYLTVTEERTNDKIGNEVTDKTIDKQYLINTVGFNSDEVVFKNDENGTTEFCIAHNLKSEDGAITLTLNVADGCENTDPLENQSLVVIKDSGISLEDLDFYNNSNQITHIALDLQGIYYLAENQEEAADDLLLKRVYKDCKYPLDLQKMQIYLEYSVNGQAKRKDFVLGERTTVWYHPMDMNEEYPNHTQLKCLYTDFSEFTEAAFVDQSFTIFVIDEFGNKTYKEYTIPKKPVFAYAELQNTYPNYKQYKLYFSQIGPNDTLVIRDSSGNSNSSDGTLNIWNDSDTAYYAQFVRDGLCGPKGDSFTSLPQNNALPALTGAYLSYSMVPDSELTAVNVNIPADSWTQYDNIYFIYENNEWVNFEKNKLSASYEIRTTYLYNSNYKIYLFGEKNGRISAPVELETENLSGDEWDNVKPGFKFGYYQNTYSDYQSLFTGFLTPYESILVGSVGDDGSGLSHFTVKTDSMVNGYTYSADEYVHNKYQDYNSFDILTIPFWDMDDDLKVNYNGAQEDADSYQNYFPYTASNMKITFYDKKNNTNEYNLSLRFYDVYEPVITTRAKAGDTTENYTIEYKKFRAHSEIYADYFVLNYDNYSNKYRWEKAGSFTSPNVANISHSNVFAGTKNKIYKVLAFENISPNTFTPDNSTEYGYSEPLFICVGEDLANGAKSSGKYDYILPVEGSDDSVLVCSDATTFVYTLVTKKSYNECKDWSVEQWEHHRRHVGDWQLDFSASEHSPQRYSIPVEDEIDDGDCYVVVAHFANGKTARSRVFQK